MTATGPPGANRKRREVLEWENRELRRVNRSLKKTLKSVVRRVRPPPVPPESSTGDAEDAPAPRFMRAGPRLAEAAQWEAGLARRAPGRTVTVPRGAPR